MKILGHKIILYNKKLKIILVPKLKLFCAKTKNWKVSGMQVAVLKKKCLWRYFIG